MSLVPPCKISHGRPGMSLPFKLSYSIYKLIITSINIDECFFRRIPIARQIIKYMHFS